MVKNLPAVQETRVWSLGGEDPLKKETTTHSSIVAWRIPWIDEPGGLQSMGSQRISHSWVTNTSTYVYIECVFVYVCVVPSNYLCFTFFKDFFMWITFWMSLKSLLNLLQHCFCFTFWFWGQEACGLLAPQPGIEHATPALEMQSLNHWTTGEVPRITFKWVKSQAGGQELFCTFGPSFGENDILQKLLVLRRRFVISKIEMIQGFKRFTSFLYLSLLIVMVRFT